MFLRGLWESRPDLQDRIWKVSRSPLAPPFPSLPSLPSLPSFPFPSLPFFLLVLLAPVYTPCRVLLGMRAFLPCARVLLYPAPQNACLCFDATDFLARVHEVCRHVHPCARGHRGAPRRHRTERGAPGAQQPGLYSRRCREPHCCCQRTYCSRKPLLEGGHAWKGKAGPFWSDCEKGN